eukprot:6456576-Amphidinium_carterae.1
MKVTLSMGANVIMLIWSSRYSPSVMTPRSVRGHEHNSCLCKHTNTPPPPLEAGLDSEFWKHVSSNCSWVGSLFETRALWWSVEIESVNAAESQILRRLGPKLWGAVAETLWHCIAHVLTISPITAALFIRKLVLHVFAVSSTKPGSVIWDHHPVLSCYGAGHNAASFTYAGTAHPRERDHSETRAFVQTSLTHTHYTMCTDSSVTVQGSHVILIIFTSALACNRHAPRVGVMLAKYSIGQPSLYVRGLTQGALLTQLSSQSIDIINLSRVSMNYSANLALDTKYVNNDNESLMLMGRCTQVFARTILFLRRAGRWEWAKVPACSACKSKARWQVVLLLKLPLANLQLAVMGRLGVGEARGAGNRGSRRAALEKSWPAVQASATEPTALQKLKR